MITKPIQRLILFFIMITLTSTARERWLFLGDSITMAGHYTDYIETWHLLNGSTPPEIINLGLSSETVSGLSEPDHPFPRPCLHTRLDRVLERIKPDTVFACYGMNCGIYHPLSEERFLAYRQGILTLIKKAQASGAKLILLTPPPYAGRLNKNTPAPENENFSYMQPAPDYNHVLATYASWIMDLNGKNNIRTIDIRPPLEQNLAQCYPQDLIHPNTIGHEYMARTVLQALTNSDGSAPSKIADPTANPDWKPVLERVNRQRMTYDRALLNDIGHGNPAVMTEKYPSPDEAKGISNQIDVQIRQIIEQGQ